MRQVSRLYWIGILMLLMLGAVGCEFRTTEYDLTVTTRGSGNVSPSGGTYDEDTLVTLTATADSGWEFSGWSGDVSGSNGTIQVLMDSDKNVTAIFTQVTTEQYTLTVTTSGSGTVSPYGGTYDAGTTVTLTAVPVWGWELYSWSGDAAGTSNSIQVTMSSDLTVMATFVETAQDGDENEMTWQAEDSSLYNAITERAHTGYTGSGYVNFYNETGSAMSWTLAAGASGNAEMTFRFANGSSTARPMDIEVNGRTRVYSLSFDSTGSWTTWAEITATVYLERGDNDIRVVSAGASGGPNMDRVIVVGDIAEDEGDDDDDDAEDPEGKFVGNITQGGGVPNDFGDYWNQITCENGGKWASVEGTRDVMNWSGIDRAYNYAKQNKIPYKQHTFVWGSQYPGWMDSLSAAEQKAEVEEWIRLYCERYPDTDMIDVVNEPDHATPGWAGAIGGSGATGHDWVIWAFEKAREYCPESTLILNDYNVLRWHTDNFISIAQKVKNRGLLDAVGAQAHGLETQNFSELQSNFNKLKSLGVPIYISEYDINLGDDNEQRRVMAEQFPLFYEDPQVAGITLWGYIYGQTWKTDTGLIRYGAERPAMVWLMDYLANN